jgi:hypothetical protein
MTAAPEIPSSTSNLMCLILTLVTRGSIRNIVSAIERQKSSIAFSMPCLSFVNSPDLWPYPLIFRKRNLWFDAPMILTSGALSMSPVYRGSNCSSYFVSMRGLKMRSWIHSPHFCGMSVESWSSGSASDSES